jgi:hypothetical protein
MLKFITQAGCRNRLKLSILSIWFWIAGCLLSGPLQVPVVLAQAQMTILEKVLEGTRILKLKIDRYDYGYIDLACQSCESRKIRLRVTPAAYVEVNGNVLSLRYFQQKSTDSIAGFYTPDGKELTRIKVAR